MMDASGSGKRKHEGEEEVEVETVASDADKQKGADDIWQLPLDFDSDDEEFLPDGVEKADRQLWMKYYKQIYESEGFDIEDFPGSCMMSEVVPCYNFKEDLELYEEILELSKLAVTKYNDDNEEAYELVDVEKVNANGCAGLMYYITFQVKNHKSGNGVGDDAPLETFQARVWCGIEKNEVKFCRPKPKQKREKTN